MRRTKSTPINAKLTGEQIAVLEDRMRHMAERNPTWGLSASDYRTLYYYLAAQKITYLYDDELYERLQFVDRKKTGKAEELLDAYLILDVGDEIQLKLFQLKFKEKYDGGISTKELYAFVDRMNRVFLRGDLQDEETLESFKEVRGAFEDARKSNPRAKAVIQCYYIVNGQNVSHSDAAKVQEIRDTFAHDRQTYGFSFETYGGLDLYNLCAFGRIPIQQESLELNYEMGDRSILHHDIGANPNGMPIQVVVGFVNVNQLIRLVDRYSNNELFEKNVRLFLGVGKEVNRRIISTVTGNESAWFGFMNNGVSITADAVHVGLPPSGKKVRVRLENMQIINGCQTVNALYHAKYALDLKDRFQGNSNVMVRIYQVAPENKTFLDALIVATNSQNAIRPEDLLSNDSIQRTLQQIYGEYRVGYERKEGETLPGHGYLTIFSKEQAGMAYLAVFDGKCSKLRNSLSRREFFRQGEDYFRAFNLRGTIGESDLSLLPDDFQPNQDSNRRAIQILAARSLEEACRKGIARTMDRRGKGSLRKGAYYLARISYLKSKQAIDGLIDTAAEEDRGPNPARDLVDKVRAIGEQSFDQARAVFTQALQKYLKDHGGNEDAALKNTEFAKLCDGMATGK
jgi:hypothetical protein